MFLFVEINAENIANVFIFQFIFCIEIFHIKNLLHFCEGHPAVKCVYYAFKMPLSSLNFKDHIDFILVRSEHFKV